MRDNLELESKYGSIYVLIDPREPEHIRYVGWTVNAGRRMRNHIKSANSESNHKANWIRKLLADGVQTELRIIEGVNDENWQERERYWIKYYRDTGHKLTNGTDGGEGALGREPSDKTRQVASERMKRLWEDMEFREAHRKITAVTMKRLHQDPEFLEKKHQVSSNNAQRLNERKRCERRLSVLEKMRWEDDGGVS